MKFRNLLLATVACAGLFTACSNGIDEAIDNGGNETNNGEKAYASFSIQMPAGTGLTRAEGDLPKTEEGTEAENKVSEVTLLFFEATGGRSLMDIQTIKLAELTPNTEGTIYSTKSLVVTKGNRFIYAFVNANDEIKELTPKDNGVAWKKITGEGKGTAADMSVAEKFAMSNASTVKVTSITADTELKAQETPLAISVERTVAKVTYNGTIFDFGIKRSGETEDFAKISLTEISLVNTNTAFYYLRRVSTAADGSSFSIGGEEEDGVNYVVDPNFNNIKPENDKQYGKETYQAIKNSQFYCLENTMTKNAQYNGVTTGAMFKAEVILKGETVAKTFYRYNGLIYTDVTVLKEKLGIVGDFTENVENWKSKDVDYYEGGICFYPYWIKHVDNNNAKLMGVMEYGIVRNNVYKLAVTSIKEIGAPTDKIDPENPDETAYAYINVKVQVKDWTIRRNENIEL